MTPSLAFLIISVVLATSFISGILGMAGGMILMGVLAWVLPVQQAMTLHATAQFFANGSRALFHRKHIDFSSCIYYGCGLAAVFAVFVIAAYVPDKITVFTLLGIAPFMSFLLPKKRKLDFTRKGHAFFCGMTVMGFQLAGGVSGPLLDIFFQNTHLTRHQTVATKAFTQTLSHAARFVYFGIITSTVAKASDGVPVWIFLAVVPAAIIGTHLSKFILEKITDKQFFKATQVALFVIGSIYLWKAASLWLES